MKKKFLHELWSNYPSVITNTDQKKPTHITKIEKFLADMLSIGENYYYGLNLFNGSIEGCHPSILKIHNLKEIPNHINQIFDLIHPEDQDFVLQAEEACIEKFLHLNKEDAMFYKASYCFRMRTQNGYQLFHHQAINIAIDENQRLVKALNIHTNIQHITPINNKVILINGFGPKTESYYISKENSRTKTPQSNLTAREQEILQLVANGFSSEEIADKLSLSIHTIKTHRKNILSKTQTKNSSELIKKCVEWGLI